MSLSCFVLYCVLHILSSLNVESKAVNTNSECVENCLAHQTVLGGGDPAAVAGSPGDRQSAGLKSRRNGLAPFF